MAKNLSMFISADESTELEMRFGPYIIGSPGSKGDTGDKGDTGGLDDADAATLSTAAANAQSAQNAVAAITNGTSTDAGTLTGAEILPTNRGAGLLQTTLAKIAAFVGSLFGLAATPEQFGAVGDGVADDAASIQAALNSGAKAVKLHGANYRCASGILVPSGVTLYSDSFAPSNPATGCSLTFDLGVAICVTLGGTGGNNGSCALRNVTVLRAAGTPPAGSIAVQLGNVYASVLDGVGMFSHQVGLKFKANGASGGISAMVSRVFTGAIYDAHLVFDSWPEARFSECRFGANGSIDKNCDTYVRVQGGSLTNGAEGPNTLFFVNCQFNQGGGAKTNSVISFVNQLPSSISDTGEVHFIGCHAEACLSGFASDSTWSFIKRVNWVSSNFNPGVSIPFFALDPATAVTDWFIGDSPIYGAMTLAPTANSGIRDLHISNCRLLGVISLTGTTTSVLTIDGATSDNGITLAGTFLTYSIDIVLSGGSFSNNATATSGGTTIVNGVMTLYPGSITNTLAANNIAGSMSGNLSPFGYQVSSAIANTVTSQPAMFRSSPSIAAGAQTVNTLFHYAATLASIGAGATLQTQYGYYSGGSLTGATTINAGFVGNVPPSSINWNFYTLSTAKNFFSGPTFIGSSTDDGSGNKLQVNTGISISPATTATAPGAGGAGALPATPTGYMTIRVNGTDRKVAYY